MDQAQNSESLPALRGQPVSSDAARSESPDLAQLPHEIKRMIVDNLASYSDSGSPRAIQDLGQLRYVNKAFAAVVAPVLFHTIPLWISKRSLRNLVEISEHPTM